MIKTLRGYEHQGEKALRGRSFKREELQEREAPREEAPKGESSQRNEL